MSHKKPLLHICLLLPMVFMLIIPASAEWKEKVLYSFQGGASGSEPAGGVVFDKAGNLYGVTFDGVVFQLKPPVQKGRAWTENMLYVFQGVNKGDGSTPSGGLVIDSAGNLYGVTAYGGTGNCVLLGSVVGCGTVYEISPPKSKGGAWKETILYSFPTAKQGYVPNGNLVFDSAGNLYGATTFGGSKGMTCDEFYGGQCGVVIELSPPKQKGGEWTEKVLHAFAGIGSGKEYGDGANPNGGLILDSNGTIYGTTYAGGYNCPHSSNLGCGTVFELTPPTQHAGAWRERQIHLFKAGNDGGGPNGGLIFDKAGSLYGTTVGGGAGNSPWGTVFILVPNAKHSWTEGLLHTFEDGDDGAEPRAGVVMGPTGELWGTASGGGSNFAGTVFHLKKNSTGVWMFGALYSFEGVNNGDGAVPGAGVVLNGGSIFGTTQVGGTGRACQGGCGTTFEVSP
jgi:hypothetical protein